MDDTSEQPPADDAEAYVGLTTDEARARAEANGWEIVREIDSDDAVITLEFRENRINFLVPEGRVIRCWFG